MKHDLEYIKYPGTKSGWLIDLVRLRVLLHYVFRLPFDALITLHLFSSFFLFLFSFSLFSLCSLAFASFYILSYSLFSWRDFLPKKLVISLEVISGKVFFTGPRVSFSFFHLFFLHIVLYFFFLYRCLVGRLV